MSLTQGNFARTLINGYELSADMMTLAHIHKFMANPVMAQNVGVAQFAVGAFAPTATFAGYRRGPQNAITAHNILSPAGIGNANDTEFVLTTLLGSNAAPMAGDVALLLNGTLLQYDGTLAPNDVLKFGAQFQARGKRAPLGNLIVDSSNVAGTITSAPFDRGAAAAAGTSLGAVAHLQVYTPAGTQASGSITLASNPADGDTLTVNGTLYTFKNTISATGHIKIGATAAITASNLFQAMIGSVTGAGSAYFAGTTRIPSAAITVAAPNASNVIALTAVIFGTAGNAYTLAKTGSAVTLSGATFASGTNGDTYTITLASATTSGGSYTVHATFAANGTGYVGERQEIAPGTLINRWLKVIASSSGSTSKLGFAVAVGCYWQS
ncbi:MAG: hypothetical protein ABI947_06490 [Chloroflexota bacterium]